MTTTNLLSVSMNLPILNISELSFIGLFSPKTNSKKKKKRKEKVHKTGKVEFIVEVDSLINAK